MKRKKKRERRRDVHKNPPGGGFSFFIKTTILKYDMPKIIIATVAERGAGKTLFVDIVKKLLPNRRVEWVRFSDIWRDILRILDKEVSRPNLSALATAVREAFRDDGVLSSAIKKRVEESGADIVILDGLRKADEVPLVKELGGILLSITTDKKIRFERRQKNPENTDDFLMTWRQFLEQDELPTEVDIRHIGETMADETIDNSGSVKEFEEKIKEFLRAHGLD